MTEPSEGMEGQKLRSLLEQLHAELAANPPTDDHSRHLLLELQRDIERATGDVAGSDAPPMPPANLRERLQESIAGFEGSHPQSAAALERVLVLLSNFGL